MISAEEAQATILRSVEPSGAITVSLDRSLGFVLAESIVASENIPPFDNAAMDGYAISTKGAGELILSIVGEIAAGSPALNALHSGEAMSIMTGARIPDGCDAVIQQEWTELAGPGRVKILRSVMPGHNIRSAGADIRKGSDVLGPGQHVRPQEIGVLASMGKRFVSIYRPPSVAILATGNEIVEIDHTPPAGKIRNSNAHALSALVRECRCEPISLGTARDDRKELTLKIMQGLEAGMLITTGGISVGKYDLVMEVLKEIGVEVKFWKVNIKPGMPLLFGLYRGKPVFALPGNPVSTVVTFLQFVKPALQKMMGLRNPGARVRLKAKLGHEIQKPDGKRHFVRGILENGDGGMTVRSAGSQVSNILSSLVKANCLIIIPEEAEIVRANEEVEVEIL